MATQLTLTQEQLNQLMALTNNGSTDFFQGYKYIATLIQGNSNVSGDTLFWFEKAAEINAFATHNGDGTSAAQLIVDETVLGFLYDGKTGSIADISNAIGKNVINQILADGGVPDLNTIISADVREAIRAGGQTIGGWGGAFYFWNSPYANGQTVGQAILSDAKEFEKFIAVNAYALHEHNPDGTAAGFLEELSTGYYAQAPLYIKLEIARVAAGIGAGKPIVGDPDHILGATYDENTGRWSQSSGAPETDPGKLDLLNGLRNERLKHINLQFEQRCFPVGTLVTLADGRETPIEQVQVGDEVLSFDVTPGFVSRRIYTRH